ncbi:MAG: outer membrane protein assembly factor BamB family protein [Kiritimatiellia bacterium]
MDVLWTATAGPTLTAPVASEKLVAVASTTEHTLFVFDPETGRLLWTFSANGPIDAPSTLGAELCWSGCRDGWVYAVRLTDGKLAWRRRVAPIEEWIVVDGQLESAWPLHGSPVVIDGEVYVAAGWHTGLDGGITVCAFKAETGAMLWRRRFEKLPGDIDRANFPVSLLSSDGRLLYMGRFLALDPGTGERQAVATPTKALFFGQSSFRDTEWVQYSNTKGTLVWSVGRTQGNSLAFMPEGEVYGVAVAADGADILIRFSAESPARRPAVKSRSHSKSGLWFSPVPHFSWQAGGIRRCRKSRMHVFTIAATMHGLQKP